MRRTGSSGYASPPTDPHRVLPLDPITTDPRPGVEQAMKNWEGKKILQLPPLIQFVPHLLAAHDLFCPPVEAIHAVIIMSLKAVGLQYVDTVLTSRQIR